MIDVIIRMHNVIIVLVNFIKTIITSVIKIIRWLNIKLINILSIYIPGDIQITKVGVKVNGKFYTINEMKGKPQYAKILDKQTIIDKMLASTSKNNDT